MKIVYLAHPVGGDVVNNLARAKKWLRWLEENFNVAIVAPWITACEVWDDSDPAQREMGMQRNFAVIRRCDELWMVGPRVSPGMLREGAYAGLFEIPVKDHTGTELPGDKWMEE